MFSECIVKHSPYIFNKNGAKINPYLLKSINKQPQVAVDIYNKEKKAFIESLNHTSSLVSCIYDSIFSKEIKTHKKL
jgi:hypothetical protein